MVLEVGLGLVPAVTRWLVVVLEVGLGLVPVALVPSVDWIGLAAIGQVGWMRLMKAVVVVGWILTVPASFSSSHCPRSVVCFQSAMWDVWVDCQILHWLAKDLNLRFGQRH